MDEEAAETTREEEEEEEGGSSPNGRKPRRVGSNGAGRAVERLSRAASRGLLRATSSREAAEAQAEATQGLMLGAAALAHEPAGEREEACLVVPRDPRCD